MTDVKVIDGEIFRDHRGQISSLNNFCPDGVKRVYFIHHPDVSVIRGWHAHRRERKWFYCIKGAFSLALVQIDNWENPSKNLQPQVFHLSEVCSQIVCVPAGYANWLKAEKQDSILLVMSDKILAESASDSYRYPAEQWINREDLKK